MGNVLVRYAVTCSVVCIYIYGCNWYRIVFIGHTGWLNRSCVLSVTSTICLSVTWVTCVSILLMFGCVLVGYTGYKYVRLFLLRACRLL